MPKIARLDLYGSKKPTVGADKLPEVVWHFVFVCQVGLAGPPVIAPLHRAEKVTKVDTNAPRSWAWSRWRFCMSLFVGVVEVPVSGQECPLFP